MFVNYCFRVNVVRWLYFVQLFDTPFQNSPYSHASNMDMQSVN